ncbi:MAG: LacI family DNA-binding transcriptional regulator [Anaerolineae bacterium]|nr:LacI family DNA-binding transcriptional regulator [Anaerolineae bacterium]
MDNSNQKVKTMKDIARLAGVSPSTASRALRDSPLISDATKERVKKVAREHAYRLHRGARNLRLKKSNTIVVILPYDFDTESALSNPYVHKMLGTVGSALREHRYDLLVSHLEDIGPAIDDLYVHSGLADGAIILGRGDNDPAKLAALAATGIPFVVLGPEYENQGYCSVGINNITSAYQAVSHLAGLGRRRIAIISDNFDSPHSEACLRYWGYLRALAEWGLPVDKKLAIRSTTSARSGHASVQVLLETSPDVDAIFVVSDVLAISVMQALGEANRRVPEDVAVVGFDNIGLCDFTIPPLTSVSQRLNDGVATLLVEKLMQLIDGQAAESAMLEGKLVIRQSCGAHLAI